MMKYKHDDGSVYTCLYYTYTKKFWIVQLYNIMVAKAVTRSKGTAQLLEGAELLLSSTPES